MGNGQVVVTPSDFKAKSQYLEIQSLSHDCDARQLHTCLLPMLNHLCAALDTLTIAWHSAINYHAASHHLYGLFILTRSAIAPPLSYSATMRFANSGMCSSARCAFQLRFTCMLPRYPVRSSAQKRVVKLIDCTMVSAHNCDWIYLDVRVGCTTTVRCDGRMVGVTCRRITSSAPGCNCGCSGSRCCTGQTPFPWAPPAQQWQHRVRYNQTARKRVEPGAEFG